MFIAVNYNMEFETRNISILPDEAKNAFPSYYSSGLLAPM